MNDLLSFESLYIISKCIHNLVLYWFLVHWKLRSINQIRWPPPLTNIVTVALLKNFCTNIQIYDDNRGDKKKQKDGKVNRITLILAKTFILLAIVSNRAIFALERFLQTKLQTTEIHCAVRDVSFLQIPKRNMKIGQYFQLINKPNKHLSCPRFSSQFFFLFLFGLGWKLIRICYARGTKMSNGYVRTERVSQRA